MIWINYQWSGILYAYRLFLFGLHLHCRWYEVRVLSFSLSFEQWAGLKIMFCQSNLLAWAWGTSIAMIWICHWSSTEIVTRLPCVVSSSQRALCILNNVYVAIIGQKWTWMLHTSRNIYLPNMTSACKQLKREQWQRLILGFLPWAWYTLLVYILMCVFSCRLVD